MECGGRHLAVAPQASATGCSLGSSTLAWQAVGLCFSALRQSTQAAEPKQPVTAAMGAAAGVDGDAADMVSVYLRQKAAEKAGGAHVPELEEGPGSEKRQV